MNALEARKTFSIRYLTGILTILIFGFCGADAQEKKSTAPAKAATPKSAPSPAIKSAPNKGGSTGTTSHGPTTATGSHGITTTSVTHGPTTSKPHGATTADGAKATTTGGSVHGATTLTAGPGTSGSAAGGHGITATKTVAGRPVPPSSHITRTANGSEVRTRANGKPADVHVANRGMAIHDGLNGNRRVEVQRADGSRIVAERGGRGGYVQRPYKYGGRTFAERTYVYNGRVYNTYYGQYYYRGVYVNYYTPAYYYGPAYYGWAYNPWAVPVAYSWGWGGYPWYGYYGYYFTPYPVYPNASVWLTDYMISTTLAAAYQAQVDANIAAQQQAAADAAALTPAVKDMIAEEVRRQIALENQEAGTAQNGAVDPASSSIQRTLTENGPHVFVAGSDLDVVDVGGTECAISNGDALQLTGPPPPDSTVANLVVLSSKGGLECRRGVTVSVAITDLQEMQNHMRETIDQGLGELQAKQGKGGLPTVPVSASAAPVKANFVSAAPPPDPNAATEVKQQAQDADQAEQQVLSQTGPPSPIPPPAPPPTQISAGQSIEEVTAALGMPKNIVDLGAKKIYVYSALKVTFKDGKVTNVE